MAPPIKPGDMYIEKPDEYKVDEGELATMCWRDLDAFCTGACQAFDPACANDETGRYTNCRLINLQLVGTSALSKLVRLLADSKNPIPGQDVAPPGA